MSVTEIRALLRPWLGEELLSHCDICAQAEELLQAFEPATGDIEMLFQRLSTLFFSTVREYTRRAMCVRLDDGRIMRVRVDDIDQMADEALYLRLRLLPHSAFQCSRLRQYAMTHDSLSALRALYVDFAAFQTEDERAFIERMIRACHPAYRWRAWLRENTNR